MSDQPERVDAFAPGADDLTFTLDRNTGTAELKHIPGHTTLFIKTKAEDGECLVETNIVEGRQFITIVLPPGVTFPGLGLHTAEFGQPADNVIQMNLTLVHGQTIEGEAVEAAGSSED